MFSRFVLPALLSLVTLVSADPDPQEPGPGAVFNEGATCHIAWGADTTGAWKSMAIELMTGDNWNMVHLTSEFAARPWPLSYMGYSAQLPYLSDRNLFFQLWPLLTEQRLPLMTTLALTYVPLFSSR